MGNVTLITLTWEKSVITRLILHAANEYTKFEVFSLIRSIDILERVKL